MTLPLVLSTATPQLVADGELTRGVAVVGIVLALLALAAWALRRGSFGPLQKKAGAIRIETTVPLGDRRQLMVVAVEGRRLLIGLTPMQVSLVTELARGESFDAALSKATGTHTTP